MHTQGNRRNLYFAEGLRGCRAYLCPLLWPSSRTVATPSPKRSYSESMIHPDPYPDETVEEIIESARRKQPTEIMRWINGEE